MITFIIGKESNLSKHLIKYISNSISISSREIIRGNRDFTKYEKEKINIIFNNFQISTKLNDISSPSCYVEQSIYSTAVILELMQNYNIGKVIYVSSSSVYGNNKLCNEEDELKPTNLHSALKIANEKLVSDFCQERKIDYSIVRVFNMYGGLDKFSVISKIIFAYKNKAEMLLINNGSGIRDFIHIDNVVEIIANLLNKCCIPIMNIGTGEKKSVDTILQYLHNKNFKINTSSVYKNEIPISIADNRLLLNNFGFIDFIKVEDYILEQLS